MLIGLVEISMESGHQQKDEFRPALTRTNKKITSTAYLLESNTKRRFQLFQTVNKIGRDESNDIAITNDDKISRFHAWILQNKGHFWVEDVGSTNGTLFNGKPLVSRTQLNPGDEITFGKTQLVFMIE